MYFKSASGISDEQRDSSLPVYVGHSVGSISNLTSIPWVLNGWHFLDGVGNKRTQAPGTVGKQVEGQRSARPRGGQHTCACPKWLCLMTSETSRLWGGESC